MPVATECPSCNSRLRVPENLLGAGRNLKCPRCAQPIAIDDLAAPDRATKQGPATAPRLPAARSAPKSEIDYVEPIEEVEEVIPAARKRRRDDDEDIRPRKPRKKKKSGGGKRVLVVTLGILFVLLVGGVGAVFYFKGDGKPAPSASAQGSPAVPGGQPGPSISDNPRATADAWIKFNFSSSEKTVQKVEAMFGRGTKCTFNDLENTFTPNMRNRDPDSIHLLEEVQKAPVQTWYVWKNGGMTMFFGIDGKGVVRASTYRKVDPSGGSSSGWNTY